MKTEPLFDDDDNWLADREVLRQRIDHLRARGDAVRQRFHYALRPGEFTGFVAADYGQVFDQLCELRDQAVTFLEWGSGSGVIAIMADLLGFESYGIEIDQGLVDVSNELTEEFNSNARFVRGSFIPDDYEWNPLTGDENFRTVTDGEPGYEELDMDLRDFDIVYAYPWPDEGEMFRDIMKQCGNPNSLFLSYDTFEGVRMERVEDL